MLINKSLLKIAGNEYKYITIIQTEVIKALFWRMPGYKHYGIYLKRDLACFFPSIIFGIEWDSLQINICCQLYMWWWWRTLFNVCLQKLLHIPQVSIWLSLPSSAISTTEDSGISLNIDCVSSLHIEHFLMYRHIKTDLP